MEAAAALPQIAEAFQKKLSDVLGVTEYYGIYNNARENRVTEKLGRKRKLAVEAVLDPQSAAEAKRKRNLRKKEKRKLAAKEEKLKNSEARYARAAFSVFEGVEGNDD